MNMTLDDNTFEVACGSIMGRDHSMCGKANQDGCYVAVQPDEVLSAVVCDGCSESKWSHVGATLAARLIATDAAFLAETWVGDTDTLLARLKADSILSIRRFVETLAVPNAVYDYFMFTVIGALVTPTRTVIYSIGDGVYAINGLMYNLGPFPNNQPPYMVYGDLLDSTIDPELCRFQVNVDMPTSLVDSFLLGTDGAKDITAHAEKCVPGKEEAVGSLAQFWTNDSFFKNSDALRRRLTLVARDVQKMDHETKRLRRHTGLLPDDTTIVVGRRAVGDMT